MGLVPKVPFQLIVGCMVSSSVMYCVFRKGLVEIQTLSKTHQDCARKMSGDPSKMRRKFQQACAWSSHRPAKTMLKPMCGSKVGVDETEESSRTSAALVDLL